MFRIRTKSKVLLNITIFIKITNKNDHHEATIYLPFTMGWGCSKHSQVMPHLIPAKAAEDGLVPMHRWADWHSKHQGAVVGLKFRSKVTALNNFIEKYGSSKQVAGCQAIRPPPEVREVPGGLWLGSTGSRWPGAALDFAVIDHVAFISGCGPCGHREGKRWVTNSLTFFKSSQVM